MRRIFVVLLLLLTACASLPPASAVPSEAVTPGPPTGTPTPILPTRLPVTPLAIPADRLVGQTVTVWHAWSGGEEVLFSALVADFNRTNPWRIQVSAQSWNDFGLLYEAVNDAQRVRAPLPDVVAALPSQVRTWASQGWLVDLTRYAHDPDYGLPPYEISDIPAAFWEQDLDGERRWGVPAQRSATVLYYNATWARELGFASPPATAEEFRAQSCAAHQSMTQDADVGNDGQGGWIVDLDPPAVVAWMSAFGGGVLHEGRFEFLSSQNQTALQFLKLLYDEGCAWLLDPQVPAPYEAFAARKALFVTGTLAGLPLQMRAMSAASNPDKWTVIAFPGPQAAFVPLYGVTYGLLRGEDESQLAAWLFVRWLLSSEVQARWVLSTGLLPLRQSSVLLVEEYAATHPQWSAAVDLIPRGLPEPPHADWRLAAPVLGDATDFLFQSNVQAGQVSALLAQIDRTLQEIAPKP